MSSYEPQKSSSSGLNAEAIQSSAAGLFKNIKRHAGHEIRKIQGGGGELEGPLDPAALKSFDDLLQQYEHASSTVGTVAKQLRSVVSAELGLAERQSGLQAALRTAGQLLNSRPGAQLDTQIIPSFVSGGTSLNEHVVAIQRQILPGLDRLLEKHKALGKEVSASKQQRLEYEHYVHKIKALEESAKSKGSGKDFEKLASNQQKLSSASTMYQQGTEALMRQLERAFQDIALELGMALAGLAKASAEVAGAESRHLEQLHSRGPAWLTAVPATHSAIVPAGNGGKPKFGFGNLIKGGKAGQPVPGPPPGPPPSAPPPPPMYTSGSGDAGQLERRLAESEARCQAGAAAFDKLRAELEKTVEQLRVAEHLQERSDKELAEVRQKNAELERQLVASSGSQHSGSQSQGEAEELRRRLQEKEQMEQAFRIRINGLESQLRQSGITVASAMYPNIQASASSAPAAQMMDTWNPFGGGGGTNHEPVSQAAPSQPASSASVPNTGNWNPFG